MLTKKEIYDIAMAQSAVDMSCKPEDFLKDENVVVLSKPQPDCRSYIELPFQCSLLTYGTNIVASVSEDVYSSVEEYIRFYKPQHCFQTPNLYKLNEAFEGKEARVCFMAEYFLPDPENLVPLSCGYTMRVMEQADFEPYYLPQWSNALCEKRKHLDVLGVGAFHGETLVGLAACSADCRTMWQIGIDVLTAYRRRGIASALTSTLASEILKRGVVPFYCAAWSNIKSVGNAVKSGFRPAWAELTVKEEAKIQELTGCP